MNPQWRIERIVTDQEVMTCISPNTLLRTRWYEMVKMAEAEGYAPIEFRRVDEPHLNQTKLVIELWPDWDT